MMQQELLSGVLVYPVISISGHCHSYSRTVPSLIPEFPALGAGPLISCSRFGNVSSTYPCLPQISSLTKERRFLVIAYSVRASS